MKSIAIQKFGGPEVLELMDLPQPQIDDESILIKIHYAGVNPVDWKIREGLLQGRMPHQFPIVLGWDGAGLIEKVGEAVLGYQTGDAVYFYARGQRIHYGTYAEYVVLQPEQLCLKPKKLSFAEAAVVPLSALTSYQVLFESLRLQAGETILIHAGAGGVGTYAIQMAKNLGAQVITTTSERHHDYVQRLGADQIIDYTREDFVEKILAQYPQGIEAVFDTVGGAVQEKSAQVLKKGGRLTSILALVEETLKKFSILFDYVFVRPNAKQLVQIKDWIEQNQLKVYLSKEFALAEARQAHEWIQKGHSEGKIVLKVI